MSGRNEYYKETHTWPRGLKAKLIRLDGNRCFVCHSTQKPFHIHHYLERTKEGFHRTGKEYNPAYLILVCPSCHGKIESMGLTFRAGDSTSPLAKAIITAFAERKKNFQNLEDFE